MRIARNNKEESPVNSARTWRCVANGCPAVAGISSGQHDTICRFHFGEPADNWQEITKRLRDRRWLVRLADMAATYAFFDFWSESAKAQCDQHGRPELAPKLVEVGQNIWREEKENPKLYASRLNAVLYKETACKSAHTAPARVEAST